MALINLKNRYIKLYKDGSYEIYTSEEARNRVKQSVSPETILGKYRELLIALEQQAEFSYYDPDNFSAQYDPLYKEYRRYQHNLKSCNASQEYPIMAQYYPDVADSIPEIIEGGRVYKIFNTIEEAYNTAKQLKQFGETTDA